MPAYYNEIDPFAAEWLRNLIRENLIAPGDVDERSIEDVAPSDLAGYNQCHFFAGVGVWSHALRLAGFPDDWEIWTGSCPCQPFSAAGQGNGFADERHLWPAFEWLIHSCRPGRILGEQVASKGGLAWLDLVWSDLEAQGYTFRATDLCAAGVGAPHIRQRLWWVADTANTDAAVWQQRLHPQDRRDIRAPGNDQWPSIDRLEQSRGAGLEERIRDGRIQRQALEPSAREAVERASDLGGPGQCNGFWADAEFLPCADGKARPVEPGTFPLAHGVAGRVGRLRAYGNAINAQAAKEFIEAALI